MEDQASDSQANGGDRPPGPPPPNAADFLAGVEELLALNIDADERLRRYWQLQRQHAALRITIPDPDHLDLVRRAGAAKLMLDAGHSRAAVVARLRQRFHISRRTAYRDVDAALKLCRGLPARGTEGRQDSDIECSLPETNGP